ncbi:60S ribosomal protein L5-like protein [Perkinsela sp. CCAP 1560/4]|nr:60S ribosomal protein L5-like protein [Perkinsela sp. CCAP 1560/4]KNH04175.1 60S ribosomal protein L5-like protein [Perkinsela sp. CCAP 1560/4]|eukprot:KNH03610.1 60S ribosomal protein L5-like protein [Perkinsela sp. CCAP 1560/4]
MTFVKVTKTKAYFKRFQVKPKRRRQGKTDYQARKKLVLQDKTKYNTPKYRVVARITGKDVISQLVLPTLTGDKVIVAAYSHELPQYGVKCGLTNYSACYATGLLLARRVLNRFGLDKDYAGVVAANGEYYSPEDETAAETRRPFKAILDTGLARTTTGARIFGVLKGAVDGGMNIPHSESRFPGYNKESSDFDAKVHYNRIFGLHVAEYMKILKEENKEKYEKHFSEFIKQGVSEDKIEDMYKSAHQAIRENPFKSAKKERKNVQHNHTTHRKRPLTLEERRSNVKSKIESLKSQMVEA